MSASPPASRLLGQLVRRGAPGVTRAVVGTLLDPRRRRAVAEALARLDLDERLPAAVTRHPLAPAALRVERSRSGDAEQVAVTMWFGEGPALPGAGGRWGRSGAMRIGAGIASAAAVAAVTAVAARIGDRPGPKLLPTPPENSRQGADRYPTGTEAAGAQ